MSTPPELILLWCPCGTVYLDSWRASMNLSLEDFNDEYIERMSSTTCPKCRAKERLGTLLTRFENDHLSMQFEAVPKHRQVILFLARPAKEQPEALKWIKEWVTEAGQAGATQLEEILRNLELMNNDLYEELAYMLFRWSVENGGKEPELLLRD
jgi:hypothetical protein